MLPEYPKASLGGIPEEILLHIVTHLSNEHDALAQLCLTDRRCKRVAEAALYKYIGGYSYHEDACAVARWPALAKNVRVCDYRCDGKFENEIERDAYVRVLENAHNIRTIKWTTTPFACKYWTPTPARKCLKYFNKTVTLFNKAVNQPLGSHNRFMQLTHLLIGVGRHLDQYPPIETLSSLFRLPALIYLNIYGFRQAKPLANWAVPTSTSLVKKLTLDSDVMEITAVTQIIASVKTLKFFECDCMQVPREQSKIKNDESSILSGHSWTLLGQALHQHRDYLETLLLAHSFYTKSYISNRDLGVLGSFSGFPKLKKLTVPIEAILDVETGENDLPTYLPEQLESFSISVGSTDTDVIISCLSMTESLWKHTHDRCVDLSIYFTKAERSHVRKSPRLFEALKLLHASEMLKYVKVDFITFDLHDVVDPDFLEESSEEGEEDENNNEEEDDHIEVEVEDSEEDSEEENFWEFVT